jgi:integrase
MNSKSSRPSILMPHEADLKRTSRPEQQGDFYWEGDNIIYTGQRQFSMGKCLSLLRPSLKESFKQHLISFTKQGSYSASSYATVFGALAAALNADPATVFDTSWMAQALKNPAFINNKSGITSLFRHLQECDGTAISNEAMRLLKDTASRRNGPSNVLSDDPEKSWLTDEEYECLLRAIWDNYDNGETATQVTLIKLLSMQYARRPVQIALLKIGDVRNSDGADSHGLTGRIIDFPGVKDMTAETGFRDSKFEPHPLPDHLWELCQIQRHEIMALYEHTLGIKLKDDELKKLPLFCSEERIQEAQNIIKNHYKLDPIDTLESEQFHLRKNWITRILRWEMNTPTCEYGENKSQRSLRPKLPNSHRTGREMLVNATRLRHTRTRQLARQGVPKHLLSHWLGHTTAKSLDSYYNDPAEMARQLDEGMALVLTPLAMAFAGTLIDSEDQATRATDPTSKLEFACEGELKSVGRCGKHSFCATTSVPIPCYRCKYFEPLVDAPHQEVLDALVQRQSAEEKALKIGGTRILLIPIDLSADICAVENCIKRCNHRKAELEITP